jgi:hypothetical protein
VARIGKKRYARNIGTGGRIILKLILRYRITLPSLDLSGFGHEQVNTVRTFFEIWLFKGVLRAAIPLFGNINWI